MEAEKSVTLSDSGGEHLVRLEEELVQRAGEGEGKRGRDSELERRVEGRGLEFRQYRTSASMGWNKDRVLPEGWMPTGVCLYLLLELSLRVGWSKEAG